MIDLLTPHCPSLKRSRTLSDSETLQVLGGAYEAVAFVLQRGHASDAGVRDEDGCDLRHHDAVAGVVRQPRRRIQPAAEPRHGGAHELVRHAQLRPPPRRRDRPVPGRALIPDFGRRAGPEVPQRESRIWAQRVRELGAGRVMYGDLELYLYRLSFVAVVVRTFPLGWCMMLLAPISATMSFWLYQDAGSVCRPHG
jgi:hypothetical protein